MANIDIGGRLHSTATGNVVAGANEILDDNEQKKQSQINAELIEAVENLSEEMGTKQGTITAVVSPTVIEDGGDPSASVQFENGQMSFAFRNIKGEAGATGAQGPQGDSVLVGQGDLPLAHVLGNDNTKAMSQKGVTDAVDEVQYLKESDITLPNAVAYFWTGSTWANNASQQSSIISATSLRGKIIRIEPNVSWTYGMKVCFVNVAPTNNTTNPGLSFCDGETGEIQRTTTLIKVIPDDCVSIIVRAYDKINNTKTDVRPAEVAIISNIKNKIVEVEEDVIQLQNTQPVLKDTFGADPVGVMTQQATTESVNTTKNINILNTAIRQYNNNGIWTESVQSRTTSFLVPALAFSGKWIKIDPNTSRPEGVRVCFLKQKPVVGSSLVFCDGEDGEIQRTAVFMKQVPSDCTYIVFRRTDYTNPSVWWYSPLIYVLEPVNKTVEKIGEEKYNEVANISYPNKQLYWINEENTYKNDSYSNAVFINISGYRGRVLKMVPSLTWSNGMRFAFLASMNSTTNPSGTPDYCGTEPMIIQSKDVEYRVVPDDCVYLYVQVSNRENDAAVDCKPSKTVICDTVQEKVVKLEQGMPLNIGDDVYVQKAYTESPFGKTSSLYAKDAAKRMMPNNVVPFILIVGQSNADGRCTTSNAPEWLSEADYTIENYMMWNNTNKQFAEFSVTSNNGAGTANGSTATSNQTYSFDAYFAHLYIEHFGTPLYALKHTIGATPIHAKPTSGMVTASWNPDIDNFPSGCRPLLAELITKMKRVRSWAADNGKILFPVAILWHQGETDGDNNHYQYYHDDLVNVLGFIRGCFGAQNIPILTGYVNEQFKSAYSQLNDVMDTLAAADEYYKVVDMSEHFTGITNDLVHYNTEAIEFMGEQMFADYLTLNKGI